MYIINGPLAESLNELLLFFPTPTARHHRAILNAYYICVCVFDDVHKSHADRPKDRARITTRRVRLAAFLFAGRYTIFRTSR